LTDEPTVTDTPPPGTTVIGWSAWFVIDDAREPGRVWCSHIHKSLAKAEACARDGQRRGYGRHNVLCAGIEGASPLDTQTPATGPDQPGAGCAQSGGSDELAATAGGHDMHRSGEPPLPVTGDCG